jgi:hypothetical protein
MYTISVGDPMNDLLRLGGQAFPTLLRDGAGHLFCDNPFAESTRLRQGLYVANQQKDSMITSWRIT